MNHVLIFMAPEMTLIVAATIWRQVLNEAARGADEGAADAAGMSLRGTALGNEGVGVHLVVPASLVKNFLGTMLPQLQTFELCWRTGPSAAAVSRFPRPVRHFPQPWSGHRSPPDLTRSRG